MTGLVKTWAAIEQLGSSVCALSTLLQATCKMNDTDS